MHISGGIQHTLPNLTQGVEFGEQFGTNHSLASTEKGGGDFCKIMPSDVIFNHILSKLSLHELGVVRRINKNWNQLQIPQSLWRSAVYHEVAFSSKNWAEWNADLVKDVDIEQEMLSFPENILEELKRSAFSGKSIRETHVMVRMPKGLTIKKLGELAKKYFPDTIHGYRYIWPSIIDELGDEPADESVWLLMTKDVLQGSKGKSYSQQKNIVTKLAETTGLPYQVPTTLEAATCILAEYSRSENRLFGDSPQTYTRCQENVQDYQVVVGFFTPAGLSANYFNFDFGQIGVAALRKFHDASNANSISACTEKEKGDFHEIFPSEIVSNDILPLLNLHGLGTIRCVAKKWNQLQIPPSLWHSAIYQDVAFSSKNWAEWNDNLVKDVDIEQEMLSLPENIAGELKRSAFPGKSIRETHVLVRMPKGLTLKKIGELAKKYFPLSPNGYQYIMQEISDELGNELNDKSVWLLMLTDVLSESRGKSRIQQKNIVAEFAKTTKLPYQVPTTLEAVTCILAEYYRSRRRLFSNDPWTFTRCQRNTEISEVIVGAFGPHGLIVNTQHYEKDYIGVTALQKFHDHPIVANLD